MHENVIRNIPKQSTLATPFVTALSVSCSRARPTSEDFQVVFLSTDRQVPGEYIKLAHDRFFPHFQFIIQ
jgi:hypothetical protein